MKRCLAGLLIASLALHASAEELEWLVDVPTALQKAKAENKIVLLDFTGSDWCGWCMKLESEVFSNPQFIAFAKANLIMVELDYPRTKPQSDALKRDNADLARQYGVTGYPTLILLNGNGDQLDKTVGYLTAGLPGYLEHFKKIPGMPHPDAAGSIAASAPDDTPDATHHAPVWTAPPPIAPVQYGDLALKGISVGPSGRLAMINNESLAVGESAQVKVKDGHVQVVCKEIRDDSAIVTVDGKQVELRLAGH
jgi:protein disulfide-isomerase